MLVAANGSSQASADAEFDPLTGRTLTTPWDGAPAGPLSAVGRTTAVGAATDANDS
jgi:hypothetical protein